MILVTGAGGKTGQAVVRALVDRGETVRALVRRPRQAMTLRFLRGAELAAEDLLSECVARPVKAESGPISEWVDQARASGLGEYPVNALAKMFDYYDRYGLQGNPQVLRWLLRRQPTTFGEFVARAQRAD